jgi:hypothetical protein
MNPPDELDLSCPECDYNLTGAPGDRCPWCGWEIDVDALVAAHRKGGRSRRTSIAIAAASIAVATLVAALSLSRVPQARLSLLDGIAVLSVGVAVLGHAGLAVIAGFSATRWPLRAGTAAELLRFAGWVSILGGVIGGASLLQAAPTPRVVRGVQVNGVFEFVLAGCLYALPGFMLLGLRLVSVREPARAKRRKPPAAHTTAPFVIQAVGPFPANSLAPNWTGQPRETTAAIEECIARIWETQSALAEVEGRQLFNGELVRMIRAEVRGEALHLELGPTCYRDFLGTNLYAAQATRRLDSGFLADALGISATILTRDGFLVYGRRNRTVAFHGGYLHTFGGLVEKSDLGAGDVCDLLGAIHRELGEELHLSSDDLRDTVITGLVRDRSILQPELLFDVSTTLSRRELVDRFNTIVEGQEHAGIEFVADEPDSIVPFLRQSAPVAPIAAAAMLLHGRIAWGEGWYEQTCYLLYGDLPELLARTSIAQTRGVSQNDRDG